MLWRHIDINVRRYTELHSFQQQKRCNHIFADFTTIFIVFLQIIYQTEPCFHVEYSGVLGFEIGLVTGDPKKMPPTESLIKFRILSTIKPCFE